MAKWRETPTGEKEQQGRGGGDRGSTAARPTLTRDWGGPQVRDPVPIFWHGISLLKRETDQRESVRWHGISFTEPDPTGSRPSVLIGLFKRETEHLCRRHEHIFRGNPDRERERERESCLFKRETEHLWLRQLMHGIGRDPFRCPPRVRQ